MATTDDISKFRRRIGDRVKNDQDVIDGDGITKSYDLRYNNVFNAVVSVNGTDIGSGYTLDEENGRLDFSTAPSDGATVRVRYSYAAYSDDQASDLIDGNGLDGGIVEALRELLADAARLSDYMQGPTQMKQSQVFDHLKQMLQMYTNQGNGNGIQIGKRTNKLYRPERRSDLDLSRADEEVLH